jgi:hypothetical protein
VFERPDVRRGDDDPETAIQLKHPNRAFTGSQELASDAWEDRVRECGGRGGLVAGDAEASTVPAIDLIMGLDKLVRAKPLGSSMPMRATPSRGAAMPRPEVRYLLGPRWPVGAGQAAADLRPRPALRPLNHPAVRPLLAPPAVPFVNCFRSGWVAVRLLRTPVPALPRDALRLLSQQALAGFASCHGPLQGSPT